MTGLQPESNQAKTPELNESNGLASATKGQAWTSEQNQTIQSTTTEIVLLHLPPFVNIDIQEQKKKKPHILNKHIKHYKCENSDLH